MSLILRFDTLIKKYKKYPGDISIFREDENLCSLIMDATSKCEGLGLQARIALLRDGKSEIPFCPICKVKRLKWLPSGRWQETCSRKCTYLRDHGVTKTLSLSSYKGSKTFSTLEEEIQDFSNLPKYKGDSYTSLNYPLLVEKATGLKFDYPLRAKIQLVLKGKSEPPICSYCNLAYCIWSKSTNSWMDICSKKCSVNKTYRDHKDRILQDCRNTWMKTLGVDCPQKNLEVKRKTEETNLERYGNKHQIRSISTQEKIQRVFLEKYDGPPTKNPVIADKISRTYQSKSKEWWKGISERRKSGSLKRYGVDFPMKHPIVKEALKKSLLQKYGVENVMYNQEIKNRQVSELRKSIGYTPEIISKLESIDFWQEEYFDKNKTIEQIARELGINSAGAGNYFNALGLKCRDNYCTSVCEREIVSFLKDKIELITQYSIENKRKSIDIYVPKLQLGIEFNGLYWHSEACKKDRNFHINKTKEWEKYGIRLVHIWEDDWELRQSIVKRKLLSLLKVSEEEKIYARKCEIGVPSHQEKVTFYEYNHLEGDGAGSISYGLRYSGKYVAMITFMDLGNGVFNLNRYATSMQVPGGFSKLLKHFTSSHPWVRIETFSDLCWSVGDLYLKNGFKLKTINPPTFHGVEGIRRINRWNYTMEKLQKRFPDLHSQGLNKFEIMDRAKILRIWDCGNLKFELCNPL